MFLLSSSSIPSGSRGTRTHKRLPVTYFQDRLLIQPDDFRIQMDVLRRQELNLRTRGSKPRISTSRNYSAGRFQISDFRLNCAGCFFSNAKAAVTGIEPVTRRLTAACPYQHGPHCKMVLSFVVARLSNSKSVQWELNPHIRHGKAVGYRYIMDAKKMD